MKSTKQLLFLSCILASSLKLYTMQSAALQTEVKRSGEIQNQTESKLNQELKNAILNNQIAEVTRLIPLVHINAPIEVFPSLGGWRKGATARGSFLMLAIQVHNVETVTLLLQRPDIQVNMQDSNGRTALHYVLHCEYRDVHNHDRNLRDIQTRLAITNLLLAHPGIDPNIQDYKGSTPLLMLKTRHPYCKVDIELIELMIHHGADPLLQEYKSKQNLYDTFEEQDLKRRPKIREKLSALRDEYLATQPHLLMPRIAESTPLMHPLVKLVTEYLIGPKQSPKLPEKSNSFSGENKQSEEKKTAASETAESEKLSPEEAMTLLFNAIAKGKVIDMQKAIKAGADINTKGAYHNSPLMLAAIAGDIPLVRALLEVRGITVNQTNAGGRTALIETIVSNTQDLNNKLEIIRLLLEAGADTALQDADKLNAYDYAEKIPAIRSMLEAHQSSLNNINVV